ncbi:MAG: YihY/virulence factor BrkB family protein [Clostridium sp.]|nr:YihY/virulence factor BrkB family protein [Clostridium sp.]
MSIKDKANRLTERAIGFWTYCTKGVWADTRPLFIVNLIKTLNITVRSFLSTDLQTQACAMTYRTLLAIVPALALLFAIGRGFGLQQYLQDELMHIFPSQRETIAHALTFVDSYLSQASEGIFVGVGIIFLLYTLISLMMNIEDAFNLIWNVREGRSIWRKISDYTAMLLILPVLMICGGGLYASMSSSIQNLFGLTFMTPIISVCFEIGSFAFVSLFFSLLFKLLPNIKVKFVNTLLPGLFAALGFIVLQWLFISGQVYVAKYNAIYGSFSFLPLMLIWMQLVWVITFTGCLLTYASQNVFQFTFSDQINDISNEYDEKVNIAIAAAIVQRFVKMEPPLSIHDITGKYGIPSKLVSSVTNRLIDCGVISRVVINAQKQAYGFQPAADPSTITLSFVRRRLNTYGSQDFIPNFAENFNGVVQTLDKHNAMTYEGEKDILLSDIKINNAADEKKDAEDKAASFLKNMIGAKNKHTTSN